MTKISLAALAMIVATPVFADHSRNPGAELFQQHLPAYLRGDNDVAGGPANELIPQRGGLASMEAFSDLESYSGSVELGARRAAPRVSTGTAAPTPATVAPLLGTQYREFPNTPHSIIQR